MTAEPLKIQPVEAEAEEPPRPHFDGLLLGKLCKETLAGAGGDDALVTRLQRAYPNFPLRLARHGHH